MTNAVQTWLPEVVVELGRTGRPVIVRDLYDEFGSAVYHDIAGSDTHEIREILGALRSHPGEVLDLAAGSGRLTLPLLAAGRTVTAIELSEGMLAILRGRFDTLPAGQRARCDLVLGDICTTRLNRRFGVVLLGTTSISLLDANGRRQLYARVREHLHHDGVFLVSTVDVCPSSETRQENDFPVAGRSGRKYRLFERYRPETGARSVTIVAADDLRPDSGHREMTVFTSSIGVLPPAQLAGELAAAGFRVDRQQHLPELSGQYVGTLLSASVVC